MSVGTIYLHQTITHRLVSNYSNYLEGGVSAENIDYIGFGGFYGPTPIRLSFVAVNPPLHPHTYEDKRPYDIGLYHDVDGSTGDVFTASTLAPAALVAPVQPSDVFYGSAHLALVADSHPTNLWDPEWANNAFMLV